MPVLSTIAKSLAAFCGRHGTQRPFRWRKIKLRDEVRVLKRPLPASQPILQGAASDLSQVFFAPSPVTPYERSRPSLLDAPSWLEEEMAAAFRAGPVAPPVGGIALLADASILAGGVVANRNGTIVAESLANTETEPRFGPFARPAEGAAPEIRMRLGARQIRLTAEPHILLKQTYDRNYGHWLVEGLPRLAAVARQFDLRRCKVIVSDWSDMRSVYLDSLRPFGVEPDQVVELGYETAHVEKLIYPLPLARHPWAKSPTVVDAFETIRARVAPNPGPRRRLYVSRNRQSRRRLYNEREIVALCEPLGFETIHPETMSFAEQVAAFAQAEIVVGNLGAALTNIAFAPAGATVLALASPHMHDSFFWDLAALKQQRYVSLHGTATASPRLPQREPMDLDFKIAPERFAAVLSDLLDTMPAEAAERRPSAYEPAPSLAVWRR